MKSEAVVRDVTGRPDNTQWKVYTPNPVRSGEDDGSIITNRPRTIQPLDGAISVELEPGLAVVEFGADRWVVDIPEVDTPLWAIIAAAVATPPNVSANAIGAAVTAWIGDNPDDIVAELSQNGAVTGAAAAAAPDAVNAYIAENIGDSHIFIDTDGVPYFDAALTGGQTVLADTDGAPYVPSIGA